MAVYGRFVVTKTCGRLIHDYRSRRDLTRCRRLVAGSPPSQQILFQLNFHVSHKLPPHEHAACT
jgi:hypothetical protein